MPSYVKSVTFDCHDPLAVAAFWASALGSNVDEDSTPERAWVEPAGWGGPSLWFQRVPEPKVSKNRQHFDLRVTVPLEAERDRLVSIGARVVRQDAHDWDALPALLQPDFTCTLVHTGEVFDRDRWVRLNADHPGFQRFVVEDLVDSGPRAVARGRVTGTAADGSEQVFAVASFATTDGARRGGVRLRLQADLAVMPSAGQSSTSPTRRYSAA